MLKFEVVRCYCGYQTWPTMITVNSDDRGLSTSSVFREFMKVWDCTDPRETKGIRADSKFAARGFTWIDRAFSPAEEVWFNRQNSIEFVNLIMAYASSQIPSDIATDALYATFVQNDINMRKFDTARRPRAFEFDGTQHYPFKSIVGSWGSNDNFRHHRNTELLKEIKDLVVVSYGSNKPWTAEWLCELYSRTYNVLAINALQSSLDCYSRVRPMLLANPTLLHVCANNSRNDEFQNTDTKRAMMIDAGAYASIMMALSMYGEHDPNKEGCKYLSNQLWKSITAFLANDCNTREEILKELTGSLIDYITSEVYYQ